MVVWGGAILGGVYPESGGRYDSLLDRWTPTYEANSPVPREYPSAIWTGNVMIVFGGLRSEEPVDTGGRYDPLTDSWSPTTSVGVSRRRVFHTAVWTGSRMIVWGGDTCPNYPYDYDTGMSYDPVSDAWTPIQYLSEPIPRRHHTAVWTGDTMVVWGGLVCDYPPVAIATGGRYDPVTNSWGSISTSRAPSARQYHTAVWTGSRMLVWGGSDNDTNPSFFNSGSAYDPVHDSWNAIARGGAPSPRRFHTTVWTGSLMLVWGGTGTSDFNTGGRYDPGSDRWTATSTTSAPTARIGHTAVWTGQEMIVWGGETSAYGLDRVNTGGRYDPVANQWSATSLYNAPSARTNHAAAWSGTFMIVWGGVGDYLPSSGGRYVANNPDTDGDGTADVCDCGPADPTVFSVPREATGLRLADDKLRVSWDSAAPAAGSATVHDVLKGMLGEFAVGNGPGETCLAPGIPVTSTSDPSTPPAGSGFWYLVRGRNTCGAGTYGFRSGGAERTSTACP
jgi:N-acetylneuraminic acid mutarotase